MGKTMIPIYYTSATMLFGKTLTCAEYKKAKTGREGLYPE